MTVKQAMQYGNRPNSSGYILPVCNQPNVYLYGKLAPQWQRRVRS